MVVVGGGDPTRTGDAAVLADYLSGLGRGVSRRLSLQAHPVERPRLKDVERARLRGLQLDPAIDPTFPGLTAVSNYWSSTVRAGGPTTAWSVGFHGTVNQSSKFNPFRARAVRGGQ